MLISIENVSPEKPQWKTTSVISDVGLIVGIASAGVDVFVQPEKRIAVIMMTDIIAMDLILNNPPNTTTILWKYDNIVDTIDYLYRVQTANPPLSPSPFSLPMSILSNRTHGPVFTKHVTHI